jgi:hypothetical protein
MLEFKHPIPVVVEDNKKGYAIYVTNGGQFENDIWCIVHCEGGTVRHYRTDQIKLYANSTFGINKTRYGEHVLRTKDRKPIWKNNF